jgi:hypothetical protein
MGRTEWIIRAFVALGETGKPVLPVSACGCGRASGQDLVRIALVANVEDQTVMRGVEYLVDARSSVRPRQDRAQMPAGDATPRRSFHFRAMSPIWVMHTLLICIKPLSVVDGATCTVINLGSQLRDPSFLTF